MIALSAVLVAGCGGKKAAEKAAERAIEKQSGGKVKADISKGKVTIKDEKGATTFAAEGGAELPDGFPKDVLVYKGAVIVMSSKQQNTFTLMLHTKDDAKQIAEAYKTSMKSQGWEEKNMINIEGNVTIQYAKEKEKRQATVSVSKSDDQAQITLIVEKEE